VIANLYGMHIAYLEATEYFFAAAAQVTSDNLDNRHPDGWSARQVIHHMADSEAQSYVRLRRLLAEPAGSVIQGYDEAAWAECGALGYQVLPTEQSLAVIKAVRASSHLILQQLSVEDFARYGTHTESGRYTLADWVDIYTRHPHEHGDQLLRALQGQE
jgi:DinB superfamily